MTLRDFDEEINGPDEDDLPFDESDSQQQEAAPVETQTAGETSGGDEVTTETADTVDDEPRDVTGLKSALSAERSGRREERDRRREAERQVTESRARLAAMEQIQQQQQAAPQDAETEEDQYWADPATHTQKQIQQSEERQRADNARHHANVSEMIAANKYDDYGEAKKALMEAAESNPQLLDQVFKDSNPAEVVYREGKRLLNGGEDPALSELRQQVETLTAQLSSQPGQTTTPLQPIPPKSTASARGSGGKVPQSTWKGPRDFGEIFPE